MMLRKPFVVVALVWVIMLLALPVAAQSAQFSGELDGVTHPWDDYAIQMNAGDTVIITLQCIPYSALDPAVAVLDSTQRMLAANDDGGMPVCAQANSSYLEFTAPATGTYIVRATSYEVLFDNDPTDENANGYYLLTLSGDFMRLGAAVDSGIVDSGIQDGRLNRMDRGAPLAVYCPGGVPEVYAIDAAGQGTLAFAVTQEQIDAVGSPETNTVIAHGLDITLYRLGSGEFEVVSAPDAEGKIYHVRFATCTPGGSAVTWLVE
jgi:hypothetical protein